DDTISLVTNPTTLVMSATSGYDDGWFSGGIIANLNDTRFILSHVANTLTISRPLASLTAGTAVALYPGCDRTLATCVSKFNNVVNALSFPWFPKNNPFTVSIK
ncbi:MAG: phage BR0599 family protein, partial [Desulfobacterales bacterium]|nr:phage BR0599 family protein [Desulfobacterales bacterium]